MRLMKKIHISLSEEIHKKLRITCALTDETIQDFVAKLISESVKDMTLPKISNKGNKGHKGSGIGSKES